MKRSMQLARVAAACFVSAAFAPIASSAELVLPSDGWASWEVPAVDDAPDWCCWSGIGPNAVREPCRLDSRREGYDSRGNATTDSVRVYARFAGGKVERVRALSASCPVHTETEVRDLGAVAADDSARWLAGLMKESELDAVARHRVSRDAVAALAIHRGDVAVDTLAGIARNEASEKRRKEAVFWLAHLRGLEGADIATSIMFGDADAEVRQHAAFAVSQSKSPQAAANLLRLASTDPAPKVRGQAWLWLAHTGSSAAEEAIRGALQQESNGHVRDQAIFALSQLPDERATRALIEVAENQALPREDRKRAVFWLSQSDSAAAQAYLEEVLAAMSNADDPGYLRSSE